MSVVIGMMVGSRKSNRFLVRRSIDSILGKIGTSDYLLVIGISTRVHKHVVNMIKNIEKNKRKNHIKIIRNHCQSFALFINYIYQKYAVNSKWFLVVHDDIELKTKNFLPIVKDILRPLQTDIGWISFTDDDYLNGHWAPSTRPGYHLDFVYEKAWSRKKMFQFHNLKENWLNDGERYEDLDYDFPSAPVICHAPFSHFIMIESEKFELCEDWSEVSLLVDEDWGLSAMKKGLSNIWLPNIIYRHCRKGKEGTRAAPIIRRKGQKVGRCFFRKWGFSPYLPIQRTIQIVRKKYGNTNMVWSIERRSFEWDYVK